MSETRDAHAVLHSLILPSGTARPAGRPHFPSWVLCLGVPAWVTGPERRLRAMNVHARKFLGIPETVEVVGRRCHEIVGAMFEGAPSAAGSNARPGLLPFCSARCPFFDRIDEGTELEPVDLCVRTPERTEHWIRILPIVVRVEDEPLLVHCALPADREHRMVHYLARVAARSHHTSGTQGLAALTPRELEILALLARDLTPIDIADRLNVSHVTVRNHVQHLLSKLDAHSTMEAVAVYLLGSDGVGAVDFPPGQIR